VQQGLAPVAHRGDLLGIDGDDQLAAGREVPVQGGVADPGPAGDVVKGGVHALLVEDVSGRGQQQFGVALGVRPPAPAEAKRLADRLELHDTPKHGSWLNVAELELSVLARQCLDRRIPDREALRREVAAWEEKRNAAVVKVDWQFTTADARVKLKRLYPTIELQ
jgi:DDE superfamily endonuclease